MSVPFYESDAAVAQYLLFHYGTPEQICPLFPEAHFACGFPARCVTETLSFLPEARHRRALDLGCAVGRSSFQLAQTFPEVVGLDFSARFIDAAQQIQKSGTVRVNAQAEGELHKQLMLELPSELLTTRHHILFQTGDAMNLPDDLGFFDYVLMANLLDRLPGPAAALEKIGRLVKSGGLLVLTSPYTWLEEYTPREKWLSLDRPALEVLKEILDETFKLQHRADLPFLIREHRRKFQFSLAEVSVWRRW